MPRFLKHPLGQSAAVLAAAYVLVVWGVPHVPPLIGVTSAPVPQSVVIQYMLTVMVGVLLWASDNEERWRRFKAPIHRLMVEPEQRKGRLALLVVLPLLVGFVTWGQVRPSVAAPTELRSVHPAPPGQIQFRDRTIPITGLENPLRHEGSIEEHYERGKEIYYRNCLACHGDALAGEGHFAHGFNPAPLSLRSSGTIGQLTESFVFWRIAKGGPGLPAEGTPWNSAMPAWEDFLTEDEIWQVIIFLYEQSGLTPRTWEEEGEEPEGAEGGGP